MPRGDGTGPAGAGPMTGRGAGFCTGLRPSGYAHPAAAFGFGLGFRRGRGSRGTGFGWRNMFYATGLPGYMRWGNNAASYQEPDPELEKQILKNQVDALKSELEIIKKRLEDKESGTAAQ
jgi:hypothetical protein